MTISLPRRPDLWPSKSAWPIKDERGTRIRRPTVITEGNSYGRGLIEFHRYSGADDQVVGIELSAETLDRLIRGLEELRENVVKVAGWSATEQMDQG